MSSRHDLQRRQDARYEIASVDHGGIVDTTSVNPREFGLTKAAYSVGEVVEQLSIGRTSLYEAVKRRELIAVKFRRKTLFYATDLAIFLTRLRQPQITRKPSPYDQSPQRANAASALTDTLSEPACPPSVGLPQSVVKRRYDGTPVKFP